MGFLPVCRFIAAAAVMLFVPGLASADFSRGTPDVAATNLGAASLADPSAMCERAIADGARRNGIPEAVLHAVSLTETGRQLDGRLRPWPWAINREGQGHWFRTRDEALAFARQSAAVGRKSFDVSCFQINYLWHGQNFPSLESMFDLDTAADYAARFLRELYAETGNWSAAAGAYHSRTPHLAQIYRTRFDRMLAVASGGVPLAATLAVEPKVAEVVPAAPRKSVTRMGRGPLIIRVAARAQTENRTAGLEIRRVEKVLASADSAATSEAGAPWHATAGRIDESGRRLGSETLH